MAQNKGLPELVKAFAQPDWLSLNDLSADLSNTEVTFRLRVPFPNESMDLSPFAFFIQECRQQEAENLQRLFKRRRVVCID